MDPAEQRGALPSAEFNLVYHVLGVGNGFPNYSVPDAPPDTTMAVGDWPGNDANSQFVQWVNVSYQCSIGYRRSSDRRYRRQFAVAEPQRQPSVQVAE